MSGPAPSLPRWRLYWAQLWPRTLLWRTFLLIALVLILAVTSWALLLRYSEREPRARQLAELTTSVVNLTRSALLHAAPSERLALLDDLALREGIRVVPADESDDLTPLPDNFFFNTYANQVRLELGFSTRIAIALNGEDGLWTSFHVAADDPEDEYWVVLPEERARRRTPWEWLGWGALALTFALAGAWSIVARVGRPLADMARACVAVGRGERPAPLTDDGPLELAVLAQAINRMSADLATVEDERAQVLAGISHDLRTPLARLRLALEMSTSDDGLKSGMVADVETMDGLLSQFLDYARGVREETPVQSDPGEIVAAVARRFPEADVELATVAPLPLKRRVLERALTNLGENARRYAGSTDPADTAPAGLTFRLSEEGSGRQRQVVLEVLDRGPGIDPALAETLKRPFMRGDAARGGVSGTGLGLAIVDAAARAHGGRLDLLPREGGGLRARISLPRRA
ncbi:two-component sensor histidine kinase [Oryzomicrobium terrae]|uniref:histidine kinase n=1 Tax=Oryzomicrobium terrae TaxID=1735038 RepID=A0A5C1E7J7_9RHOO|nr:ATP-binding protein [Oryzomicrobium terrae]QEL64900.1 two-component sensor histidine kinase [Oryzomicrobium terrae]